jgi:hypothetical protein
MSVSRTLLEEIRKDEGLGRELAEGSSLRF